MSNNSLVRLSGILAVLVLLSGCPFNEEDSGGGGSSGSKAVTSSSDASMLVRNIAGGVIQDKLLYALANGTHTATVVNGLAGTATVSGVETYTVGASCGTDCVTSSSNVNITVIFNGYSVMSSGNLKTTVSGTVSYTDNTWSRQSGLNYSSGGSVSVTSKSVVSTDIKESGTSYGYNYNDSITFYASGSDAPYVKGWCMAKNGTTYYF